MSALLNVLIALVFVAAAWHGARGGRRGAAVFWGLLAALFAFGDLLPPALIGACVVLLALMAATPALGRRAGTPAADAAVPPATPAAPARDVPGDPRALRPVVAIPLLTLVFVLVVRMVNRNGALALDNQVLTLAALALASCLALLYGVRSLRADPAQAVASGGALLDAIGWAAVLPLALAVLGSLFAAAHVGDLVASLVTRGIPIDSRLACVVAYGFAMLAMTAIMGNAFAAFPVVMGGIGLPLLVGRHGADPAVIGAIGMLTGYCGTLLTPMAANFNLVPVALLELRDEWAVIRAQAPTGLMLWVANVALMMALGFR